MNSFLKRATATVLAAILAGLAPGLESWRLFAQTAVGPIETPVNAGNGVSGSGVDLGNDSSPELSVDGGRIAAGLASDLRGASHPEAQVSVITSAGPAGPGTQSASVRAAAQHPSALTPGRSDPGPSPASVVRGFGAVVHDVGATVPVSPATGKADAVALKTQRSVHAAVTPGAGQFGGLRTLFENANANHAEDPDGVAATATVDKPSALAPAEAGPVLSGPAVAAPAPAAKKGLGSRLYEKLAGDFDLSKYDASEKAYLLGQVVFVFGITIYLVSMPLFVHALTGSTALTGVVRTVHYWTFGAASLFAGEIVQRTPMKRVLVRAGTGRAIIFGAIGVLALGSILPWPVFLGLVGLHALLVAHNHLVDIDAGGAAKVIPDKEKRSQALYLYKTVRYAMLLVMPWVLGFGMDLIDKYLGAGTGAKIGMILFSGALSTAAWIYATKVKVAAEEASAAAARGLDAVRQGLKTGIEVLVGTPKRIWKTAKLIWGNTAILARATMSAVEQFIEDSLFFVVLPTYVIDVLGQKSFGNGLALSATYLGGMLASMILVKRSKTLEARFGEYGFIVLLSVAASLAFLPSIGLWTAGSLWVVLPLVALMKFLYDPIQSKMTALLQTEIDEDPLAKPEGDNIWSLLTTVEVVAAGAGGLVFSWLFKHSGPADAITRTLGANAPMKIVTISLAAVAAIYLLSLHWLKRQIGQPRDHVYYSDPDPVKAKKIEAKMFVQLKANLETMGLPPYRTEVVETPVDPRRPTVALLAPASTHKLAVAREGGRQSPGDVHLVMDPSWLIQRRWPNGKNTLLMTKGLYFDKDGVPVVAEYKTPRPVRYWGDWFTQGANSRNDGVALEENSDVPQSNSTRLEEVTNDKIGTRLLMTLRGIAVPATLAFLMAGHPLAADASVYKTYPGNVTVAAMPAEDVEASARHAEIEARVDAFLDAYDGKEIVVKPSGPQWHSGMEVTFFWKTQRADIIARVLELAETVGPNEAVLVDGRVDSEPIDRGEPDRKFETTLRVLVARTPWGGAETTGVFARNGPLYRGPDGMPTSGEARDPRNSAHMEGWGKLLHEYWKLPPAEAAELDAAVRALGPRVFAALAANEAKLERRDGEPYQAQTDLIGLDVMIERRDGKLTPVVIEINDHDSGGQYQLEDSIEPQLGGEHSRAWVATMLSRARQNALQGKRIVVVGAGYSGKRFIFERLKELGVEVVLVADKSGRWAKDLVSEYIEMDTTDREHALATAKKKLMKSARKNGEIDGVTSFWEDDVPLTAEVAAWLKKPYHTIQGAKAAKSKFLTRELMFTAGLPTPRFLSIKSREDLETGIHAVGFPAILKPVFGTAAMSVVRVNNAAEARAAFEQISKEISPANDSVFTHGTEIIMEQYLDGPEVDVDMVVQNGKIVFDSVTDNWPTKEPHFLATGSSLPSTLSKKRQDELVALAAATAKALGLTDGVIHIEMKYTSDGPRVVEANGRMGGVYVRDWVKEVWGVDLVEQAALVAAGVPAAPYKPAKPLAYLEGKFLIPDQSGILHGFLGADELETQPGFHGLLTFKKPGDWVKVPEDQENPGYDRAGMLISRGATREEARSRLDSLGGALRVDLKLEP